MYLETRQNIKVRDIKIADDEYQQRYGEVNKRLLNSTAMTMIVVC